MDTDMVFDVDACARTPLLLHGRQMPRLFHDYDRLLTRTNCRHLWRMQYRAMPTDRW